MLSGLGAVPRPGGGSMIQKSQSVKGDFKRHRLYTWRAQKDGATNHYRRLGEAMTVEEHDEGEKSAWSSCGFTEFQNSTKTTQLKLSIFPIIITSYITVSLYAISTSLALILSPLWSLTRSLLTERRALHSQLWRVLQFSLQIRFKFSPISVSGLGASILC